TRGRSPASCSLSFRASASSARVRRRLPACATRRRRLSRSSRKSVSPDTGPEPSASLYWNDQSRKGGPMSSAEPLRSVATIDRNDRERSGPCRSGPAGRPGASSALLAAFQLGWILAITFITLPLPVIQRDFDLTRGELALLGAAYGLSCSGLLLLGGRLADITGRRRVLRVGA